MPPEPRELLGGHYLVHVDEVPDLLFGAPGVPFWQTIKINMVIVIGRTHSVAFSDEGKGSSFPLSLDLTGSPQTVISTPADRLEALAANALTLAPNREATVFLDALRNWMMNDPNMEYS